MSASAAVGAILAAAGDLVAIVGTQLWAVEPDRSDLDTTKVAPPFCLYSTLADPRLEAIPFRRARMRIDCVGETEAQARAIAEAARAAIMGYSGVAGGTRVKHVTAVPDIGAGAAVRDEDVNSWWNARVGIALIHQES